MSPDSLDTGSGFGGLDHDVGRIVSEIAEQAATGTVLTPLPEEWVLALPELDGVACEWSMEHQLQSAYMWYEDGAYYATNLGPGLEDREDQPLDRFEAESLLEGIGHKPVNLSEVPGQ